MAGYTYTSDLLEDVLFRAGEPADGTSDFAAAGLRYLNRSYQALYLGGAEFEPSIQEDWWFLRKSPPGVLTLDPVYMTGTVTVTTGSPTVTFSVPPVGSVATWFIVVDVTAGFFRVLAHTAGAATATLDSPYTGVSGGALAFWVIRLEYDVAPDVLRLTALTPASSTSAPTSAEMIDENTLRVDYGAGLDTITASVRVEYDYLFRPPPLTNATSEEPVVPLQWRRLIADGALFFLHMDKNDNRTDGVGLLLIKGLKAMARENHHKQATQNGEMGKIRPRQDDLGAWGEWEFQVLRP